LKLCVDIFKKNPKVSFKKEKEKEDREAKQVLSGSWFQWEGGRI
jgi:hypothetical protein